jgi:23S rRNA pseudouridine1911/1915/1917 synthase
MLHNDGFTYVERVGVEADGESLHAYLCRRYRHSTAAEWLARIASGDVLLSASAAPLDTRLKRGQTLVWRRPPWEEPEAPLAFTVLYEDDDVLAVSKPAGLPTMPGANFLQHTLSFQVQRHAADATALHRLGRWTSGVVLFARNTKARAELSRQLRAREVVKRYRALGSGDPPWNSCTVDRPIGEVPHLLLGSIHAASADGRESASSIDVLERRAGSFLCDVRIATGRPHQIRIHLAAAGHPLVGDPLYVAGGVPGVGSVAVPGAPGYHLHAAEIRFTHPRHGREVVVTSEPPALLRPRTSWCGKAPDVTLDLS